MAGLGALAAMPGTAPANTTALSLTPSATLALAGRLEEPSVRRSTLDLRASRDRISLPDLGPPARTLVRPARPTARPRVRASPVIPGCSPLEPLADGLRNGLLPDSVLCSLPGASAERLRAEAALSFVELQAAYRMRFGSAICVTDGYRTLAMQETLRRIKPRLAAVPGTSQHGWGLAVDLACGVQSFASDEHEWFVDNAARYGWVLPVWARHDGSTPEPWHWEFVGKAAADGSL